MTDLAKSIAFGSLVSLAIGLPVVLSRWWLVGPAGALSFAIGWVIGILLVWVAYAAWLFCVWLRKKQVEGDSNYNKETTVE